MQIKFIHPSRLYTSSLASTPGHPFIYHPQTQPYHIPSPFPQTASTDFPGPTLSDVEGLAIAFAEELFYGINIIPGTSSSETTRAVFKWPIAAVTTEDRFLVALRAIRKAGFPTIGSFLAALFEGGYAKHASVSTSVAAFLRGAEKNPAHHPVNIVDQNFRHFKSQDWIGAFLWNPPSRYPATHYDRPLASNLRSSPQVPIALAML
ncbi:hypothetical protein K438DRAFT_307687 [Mycena galopus ATCC 62051]|nr:hypothetical protein K438DRAFT_307687 [Mycena galopus ATCC 62051]